MFFSNKYGYIKGTTKTSETKQEDEASFPAHKPLSADLDRRIDASIKSIQDMKQTRQQNTSRLGHNKTTQEEFLEVPKPGNVQQSVEGADVPKGRSNRARARRSVGAVDGESVTNNVTKGNINRRSRGRRRSIGTTRASWGEAAASDNWGNFVASFDDEEPAKAAPPPRSRRAAGNRKATAQTIRAKQGEEMNISWQRQPRKVRRKQISRSPVRRNHNTTQRGSRNRSLSKSNHSQDFAKSPGAPSGRSSRRGRRILPLESVDDATDIPMPPKLGEGESYAALPEATRSAHDRTIPLSPGSLGSPRGSMGSSNPHTSNGDQNLPTAPVVLGVPKKEKADSYNGSEEVQISWQRVPPKWGASVRNKTKKGDPKPLSDTLPKAALELEDTKHEELDHSSGSEEMQISWQRIPQKWGVSVRNKKKEGDPKPPIAGSKLLTGSSVGQEDTKEKALDRNSRSQEMQISWQRVPSVRNVVGPPKGKLVGNTSNKDDAKLQTAPVGHKENKEKTLGRISRSQEMQISWQRVPSVRNVVSPPKGKLIGNTNNKDEAKLQKAPVGCKETKGKISSQNSRSQEVQISWQRVPSVRNVVSPPKGKLVGNSNSNYDVKLATARLEEIKGKASNQNSRSQEMQISWQRVPSVRNIVGPSKGELVGSTTKKSNMNLPTAPITLQETKCQRLDQNSRSQEMQISWQRVPSSVRKIVGPATEKLGRLVGSANKDDYAKLLTAPVSSGEKTFGRNSGSQEVQIAWQRVPSVRKITVPPEGKLGRTVQNTNVDAKLPTSCAGLEDSKDDGFDQSIRSEGLRIIGQEWLPSVRKNVGPRKAAPAPTIWRNRRPVKAPISMQIKRQQKTSTRLEGSSSTQRPTNRQRISGDRLMRRSAHSSAVVRTSNRNGDQDDAVDRNTRSTRSTGMQMTWRQETSARKHAGMARTPVPIHIGKRSPRSQGKRQLPNSSNQSRMQSPGNSRRERRSQRAKSAEGETLPVAPLATTGAEQGSKDGIGEIAKLLERSNKLDKQKDWRRVRGKGSRAGTRRAAKSPARAGRQQTVPTHWQRNDSVMIHVE